MHKEYKFSHTIGYSNFPSIDGESLYKTIVMSEGHLSNNKTYVSMWLNLLTKKTNRFDYLFLISFDFTKHKKTLFL